MPAALLAWASIEGDSSSSRISVYIAELYVSHDIYLTDSSAAVALQTLAVADFRTALLINRSGEQSTMSNGNGNGNGNGHGRGFGRGDDFRELLDDSELAGQFAHLVALAEAKGLDQDEIGYGLLAATAEHLLDRGETECCIMQLLLDYTANFYNWWHDELSEEAAGEEGTN